MARKPQGLGPWFDPFHIVRTIDDGDWTLTVRTIASPTGLKVWSLNIEPTGLVESDYPPKDTPGAGINTGVLRKISFPELRQQLASRQTTFIARALKELDGASPEGRDVITRELARVEGEKARSSEPMSPRRGRRPSTPKQRAQWAEDVLEHKDRHGYRQALRQLWFQQEGKPIKVKAVDSRMTLLRDSGWLIGYGRNSMKGPELLQWQHGDGAGAWEKENTDGED
jgi:hypothetical protein